MKRVLANAVTEFVGPGLWSVEVIGIPPHDQKRTYLVTEQEESRAAFEGIRRFCDEMERADAVG